MADEQTGPNVDDLQSAAPNGSAAAGLGLLMASVVAATRQLPAMLTALKGVTEALTGHRKLMFKQLETFDEHLDKQRASFDRWSERNTESVGAFRAATQAHRQAAEDLRAAVEAHNRAADALAQARDEIAELKAMVSILVQREGLTVSPASPSSH